MSPGLNTPGLNNPPNPGAYPLRASWPDWLAAAADYI